MKTTNRLRAALIPAILILAASRVAGAETNSSAADADWQKFLDALKPPALESLTALQPAERMQAVELYYANIKSRGEHFIETYPTDPRRWSAVMRLSPTQPRFAKSWETGGGSARPVIDEAAAAAWKAKVESWKQAVTKATDVPPEVGEQLLLQAALTPFNAASSALRNGHHLDLAYLRGKVSAYAARNPGAASGAALLHTYMGLVEKAEPGRVEEQWASFTDSPNRAMAEMAASKVGAAALMKRPLDLTFTDVSGRPVDLKALRGKVVLIDFWATWCGPCIAELPNVKRVYAAYHDKGFEVVGITLENARLLPADTPEQVARKLASASKVLTDFTTKEKMPWPQHFDGKYWKNDFAVKFGIGSIPAMFLLDRDGRIVSTNARGERLEAEVRRLLGP